jgi:hypothetical protein
MPADSSSTGPSPARVQAQGEELAWEGGRQRRGVGVGQSHREHVAALGVDADDPQGAESGPGRRRGARHRGQAGVAGCRALTALGLVEQRPERCLPAGAELGDVERPDQLLAGMARQVEQRAHLRDVHAPPARGDLDDLVAGLDLSFGADAEIEPGTPVGHQQGGHPRLLHPEADAVAGDPRLGDLELRLADPVAVTDAHLVVRQPIDGEVLSELPVDEIVPAELLLPVAVGVDLVDQHRAVLAAVAGEVALPIAVEVEPARHPGSGHRLLPDAGVDHRAAPGHVLRLANVHRQQPGHRTPPLVPASRARPRRAVQRPMVTPLRGTRRLTAHGVDTRGEGALNQRTSQRRFRGWRG